MNKLTSQPFSLSPPACFTIIHERGLKDRAQRLENGNLLSDLLSEPDLEKEKAT